MPLIPRQRTRSDGGYALLPVIGFGTALVLTVGAVSGYALQSMDSAGRAQGFQAAVQAAQAGVDDFVARINQNAAYGAGPVTTWQTVPGSEDGAGTACGTAAATAPPNCPQFRHAAVATPTGYVVTSVGKSRGVERAVQVTLKQRAFTDYLYFSDVEAADPADGFAYPALLGGAPANCGKPAWGADPRPASGCVVPAWRGNDRTEGSRVHTDDVFAVTGSPTFDSRVTASIAGCATDPAVCVTEGAGADPDYRQGQPAYADDLDMPASGLAQIAANATAAAAGCTYYGPTRIRFEGDRMRVWSPQTPYTAACGGGIPNDLLDTPVNVVVNTLNRTGICSLLGVVTGLLCAVLHPLGSIVKLPLSDVLGDGLLTGNSLLQAVNGLVAEGDLVPLPASGAIYVRENALGNSPIPDPTFIQCLLGSALGMYSTVDTNLTAGLLNSSNAPQAKCRAGTLFVDGELDGRVTAGVAGDIVILSDLTYDTADNAEDDRLGLVATGPVEVYNPLQCTLALGTCLSLDSLSTTLQSALSALRSAGTGNLTQTLGLVPGYGEDVTVEASILSLEHRFGMQLPLLSLSMSTSLLNQLVNLNIDPPKLVVHGSIAQRYRGIVGAELLNLNVGVPRLNLASANIDIGYEADYRHDERLRADPPLYFPAPTNRIYDPQAFAEVDVPA